MEMEAKLKKAFINLENYHDKLQIEFAYLFGSYAEGNYAPTSDIDLAVYFVSNPSLDEELSLHVFLTKQLKTDKIDLLVLNRTKNLILLEEIIRKGKVIYDRNSELRKMFECKVIHNSIDFKIQRKVFAGR
ncbi:MULTISPECIES: type VII toxin-antitoxin system MntA family adenylyltransferase antitoxin [Thermodesulfovibrio]|uniref:type VII toxin-antitoxin system MntA family adenylyltransferase antitoxin n=1 Tax=Thermodesulfovibrio yellowstonii TaxID=28262 RepID=UPI0003F8690F|nr:nucleotidyltransferase domain-containing protein [Thermodesulfovibrio islandicus]